MVFAKFNHKVHYPPPYESEVWHFKEANRDHIKRVINGFPWERSFPNLGIQQNIIKQNIIKQLKIYFQISYLIKLSHFTTETRLG